MDLFRPSFDLTPYTRTGENLMEIGFPLGGIGAGCVSLDGRGGLKDWEIYGRPNKGSMLDYTFPAIWVCEEGEEPRALALQDRMRTGWVGRSGDGDYGHGRFFQRMDGLPGFDGLAFAGTWPVARLRFLKPGLPVEIELAAISSFVPADVEASSYPVATLVYRVTNRSTKRVKATLAWSMQNPVVGQTTDGKDGAWNRPLDLGDVHGILFGNDSLTKEDVGYGEAFLATDWGHVSRTTSWTEEGWWDSVRTFWNDFSATGALPERGGDRSGARIPGTLGCEVDLAPGESVEVPFVFGWWFPNRERYWNRREPTQGWRAHYALRWKGAAEVAAEFFAKREERTRRTLAYEDALYNSSLPPEVLESVGATTSILQTPTLIRLEDGSFWAWEGCSAKDGCCEGTCTHVWNYALTHTYLFPEIQRSFLDSNFQHGFNCGPPGKDGGMRFRIPVPMAQETKLWHAASDGQLGLILQAYREWRISADRDWLACSYPALKLAMAYAWVQWDRDRDGLVDGDMHNTYDINFEGPNPLTQFFYLGALRALAAMAVELGDEAYAFELQALEASGSALTMERLHNGEFFVQLGDFQQPGAPKYQHGQGCLSDQLLGQLPCSLSGLGSLVEPEAVRQALQAIFRHNFRSPLGDHENLQRVYAGADESGLLLCTWPDGGMPTYPFVYSDEVWTGIEYQVASHLALEGFVDECLAILRGIRERYDGRRRNPWNEFECGSHYARALASYGVLIALTGFSYDGVAGRLEFGDKPFKSFWSVAGAWGTAERRADGSLDLQVIEGRLPTHA